MTVRFHKLDERRYPVSVITDNGDEFKMPSHLRSDPYMPHDLWSFILEREFGLKHAIFGQLVEAGDAARFFKVNSTPTGRKAARQKIGDKNLASEGVDELAPSERGAIVCLHRWISRSTNKGLRKRALEIEDAAQSRLRLMSKSNTFPTKSTASRSKWIC